MARTWGPRREPPRQRCVDALAEGTRVARRAAFGEAITRLQQMSGASVATLGKMMVEPTAPPSTRVRAAEVIINQAAKAIGLEDIEARVAELERAGGNTQTGRTDGVGRGSV
jgi:hypothetical protein